MVCELCLDFKNYLRYFNSYHGFFIKVRGRGVRKWERKKEKKGGRRKERKGKKEGREERRTEGGWKEAGTGLSPKRAVAVGTQAGLGSPAFAVQVSLAGGAECSHLKFSQDPRKTEKNVIFSLVNFFFICFKVRKQHLKGKGPPQGCVQ